MSFQMLDYLHELDYDDHGWLTKNNQEKLKEFFQNNEIKTVIEVGTWLGKSAFFMANMLPEDGKLFAVDHWMGDQYIQMHGRHNHRLDNLYHRFLSNLKKEKLEDKIIPIRMSSQEAAKALNVQADLIYIDAGHEEESCFLDICAWIDKLKPNGIFCGDDYRWKSVQSAVKKAAEKFNLNYQNKSPFWWFEKRSP